MLIITALPFFSANVSAVVVDPAITPSATIVCAYPIAREDGTPIAISEIATIMFYVGRLTGDYQDQVASAVPIPGCKLAIDVTKVLDGDYFYVMTAIDTDGRESSYSSEITLTVKRIAKPNPPTGLVWQ